MDKGPTEGPNERARASSSVGGDPNGTPTDGWPPETEPPSYGPKAVRCAVCGRDPVAQFSFRSNIGYGIGRREETFEGPLCRECARGVFRRYQSRNLSRGWWGVISFVVTILYLFRNAAQVRRARSLHRPTPPLGPEEERRLRGKAVALHPAVWIGTLLVIAVIAGVVFIQTNGTESGGSGDATLIQDDFSVPNGNWKALNNSSVQMGFAEGAYQILVRQAGQSYGSIRGSTTAGWQAVSVQVVASKATPATSEGFFGVACMSDVGGVGYAFYIDPDARQYLIDRIGPQSSSDLAVGRDTRTAVLLGGTNKNVIHGYCVRRADGSAVLIMSVNGHSVLAARDPRGVPAFVGMGLFVDSLYGGTDVRFDDAAMERSSLALPPLSELPIPSPTPSLAMPRLAQSVFYDDFSNPGSGWYVANTPAFQFGYLDGLYQIDVKRAGENRYWLQWGRRVYPSVGVEVSANLATGSTPEGDIGVACVARARPVEIYVFVIDPTSGGYEILKIANGTWLKLLEGASPVIGDGDVPNRIRGDCTAGQGGAATSLVMFVNGQYVARFDDTGGFTGFNGVGMYVDSLSGGTDARFDDIAMGPV